MKRGILAFEDNSAALDNLDTDKKIGGDEPAEDDKVPASEDTGAEAREEPSTDAVDTPAQETPTDEVAVDPATDPAAELDADGEDGTSQEEPENDLSDPDKPLEIFDPADLKTAELDKKNTEAELKDNKEVVEAVAQDGQVVFKDLDESLEHFLMACHSRATNSLKLANESFMQAQELAGFGAPSIMPVPEGETLEDAALQPALESLGGTLSNIIKAVMEMLRKAMKYMRDFLVQTWRQMNSLEVGIQKAGAELLAFRKNKRAEMTSFYNAQGLPDDHSEYVRLGRHKALLSIQGEIPPAETGGQFVGLSKDFEALSDLISQAFDYERLVATLPAACDKYLEITRLSTSGQHNPQIVDAIFGTVPKIDQFMPKNGVIAVHVHDISPEPGMELVCSPEYIGNFFQVGVRPDPSHQATFTGGSSTLAALALSKVVYTRDTTMPMANDKARFLHSKEIEAAQKTMSAQTPLLISMQRLSDSVLHRLDALEVVLKKAEAANWQNNQSDPVLAAEKSRRIIELVQAIGSVSGSTNRYFTQVIAHVFNVRFAWLAYLTATHKRDLEIWGVGDPRDPMYAPKKDKAASA